jgi:ring-1,2-phenylacetyl-CoA epoxidase subunit PaaD
MVTLATFSKEAVLAILSEVADPELPFLNIVELGIVRDAEFDGNVLRITITPTYFGCPILHVIRESITSVLQAAGFKAVAVQTAYAPAWTTDWLSEETRHKLKAAGIAPPEGRVPDAAPFRPRQNPAVQCPYCDSHDTEVRSQFGATACKSLHYCKNCLQPFEHFKCI